MGGKAVAWPGCRRWALDEAVSILGCRKATLQLPDADYLSSQCQSQSSRAQNRDFCALLPARTLDFRRFEHKIGVFVRFWPSGPTFSGVSLLLEEHFRVMEQFDSTFVVAHVLRIYDTAYCLKLHYGSGDIEGCSEYFYLNS